MSQLDLVWELENRNNQLENLKKKLDTLNNDIELNILEKKLQYSNNQYKALNAKLENYKVQIYKYTILLKEYEFKLKEIDKDLYNGTVSDLKQLNYLSEEKVKFNILIEETEINILTLMETVDSLEIEVVNIHKELSLIDSDIKNLKKRINKVSQELIKMIENEQSFIDSHIKEIDTNLLNRYNVLRKIKGSGIVRVQKQVCSGCNMHIPTSLGGKLKNKNEIIYCESCGRILYFIPDSQ